MESVFIVVLGERGARGGAYPSFEFRSPGFWQWATNPVYMLECQRVARPAVQPRVGGVHGATTPFIRVAPIFFTALALSQTSEHLSLLHGAFVVGRVSYMEFEALGAVLQEIADLKAELGA